MTSTVPLCALGWLVATGAHIYVYKRLMPFRTGLPQTFKTFDRLIAFVTRTGNYTARNYSEQGRRYLPWLVVTAAVAWVLLLCTLFSFVLRKQ